MREQLSFDIEVSHNQNLPPAARELHAVLSVSARPAPGAAAVDAAEVIMFDCSAAAPGVDDRVKQAVMAAIDAIDDGVAFAVIAGRGGARVVYPVGRQLAPSTPENRAVAKAAVSIVTPSAGSTTLRDWISLADQLFVEHAGAVRHALLVTASDSGEDLAELERVAESCAGHFVCDCVGVGDGGEIGQLRAIAARLGGSVEVVADPANLTTNLVATITGVMAKSVTDTALRLWLPKGARLRSLEQVSPVHNDLTARRGKLGYRTGAWGVESREFHLAVDLDPSAVGQSVIATRARLVRPAALGEPGDLVPLAAGLVTATWSDDVTRTLPLDPRVAKVLGKAELAEAVHAAMTARGEGNAVAANEQFSEAVRHAAEVNDADMLSQLDRVVASDPVTGAVRLKNGPEADGLSVVPKPPKPVRRRRAVVEAIESTVAPPPAVRPRGRHRRSDDVLPEPAVPEPETAWETTNFEPAELEQTRLDPMPAEPECFEPVVLGELLPVTAMPPSLEPDGFDLTEPEPEVTQERPEPEPSTVDDELALPDLPSLAPMPDLVPREEPRPAPAPPAPNSWGGWPTLPASQKGRAARRSAQQQPAALPTVALNRRPNPAEAPVNETTVLRRNTHPSGETPRTMVFEPSQTTVLRRGAAPSNGGQSEWQWANGTPGNGSRGDTEPDKPANGSPTAVFQPIKPQPVKDQPGRSRHGTSPPPPQTTVIQPIAAPPAVPSPTPSPAPKTPTLQTPVPATSPPSMPSLPPIPHPAVPQHSAPQPVPPPAVARPSGAWPAPPVAPQAPPGPAAVVRTGFALPSDPRKDLEPGRTVPCAQNYWFWVEIPPPPAAPLLAEDALLSVSLFEFSGEFAIKQDAALGQIMLGADGSSTVVRQPSIVQDGNRLCFPVTTPYTLGVARLRCNVYWRQMLLQSILVSVHVTAAPSPLPGAVSSTVDYRVADPVEALGMAQVPEHAASLMLNDDGRGSQSVRVLASDGREVLRAETSLGEHQLAEEIRMARGALNRVAWASEEPWREGLDYRYAQPPTIEQFTLDLGLLATHGHRLHQLLMSGVPERVSSALAKPGFVQVPLTQSARHVLPTAMIYDLPLDIGSPVLRLCTDFLSAVQRGSLYGSPCFLRTCAHALRPDPKTVCPGGFWGFRHALGLPLSLGTAASLPAMLPVDGGVRLAGGLYRGFASAEEHGAALRRMLPWRSYQLGENREATLAELGGDPQIVYFYCHGGIDGDVPYLRIGRDRDEVITPASLHRRRLRWQRSRPLVFLNTSRVTGVRPERAMDFVRYFVDEALACGVIGTEITVFEELADEFGQEVLRSFLINRDAIGVAVMRARISLLAKGNPLGLAYVPYVSPSIGLAER